MTNLKNVAFDKENGASHVTNSRRFRCLKIENACQILSLLAGSTYQVGKLLGENNYCFCTFFKFFFLFFISIFFYLIPYHTYITNNTNTYTYSTKYLHCTYIRIFHYKDRFSHSGTFPQSKHDWRWIIIIFIFISFSISFSLLWTHVLCLN